MNKDEFIINTLRTLLGHLNVSVTDITIDVDEKTTSTRFVITTNDSVILIGERGDRLMALNHLLKRIVEKNIADANFAFMVDVNDYQKKRIDAIRTKAHMLAERARYFKSTVELDPMSSYERMIVHSEFTDVPDITTESLGFGKDRRVALKYKDVVI